MTEEDGDFLSRWSRRKRKVDSEDASRTEPDPEPAQDDKVPEPATEEEEAALLERLGLPVPETLTEGDDFSGFMQAGVPQFLRKRALRVLWKSNPVLANLDGLNDYDDDFNSPEFTQKVLATGYQVGRGFVKAVLEDNTEADDETPEEARQDPEAAKSETSGIKEVSSIETVESNDDREEPGHAFRPRRMRFEF